LSGVILSLQNLKNYIGLSVFYQVLFMNFAHIRKVVLFVWFAILALGAASYVFRGSELDILPFLRQIFDTLNGYGGGIFLPIFFIILFMARPLLLIPAIVMSILAYTLFGPVEGFFILLISEMLSATSLFLFVKYLAGDEYKHKLKEVTKKFNLKSLESEREQFYVVTILRLASLSFDLVTSMCALAGMKLFPFIAGTTLVSVPWIILFFWTYGTIQTGSIQASLIHGSIFLVFIGLSILVAKKSKIFQKQAV
jgi:uncharacterized membrane protein YdjX (TVP38/TMEM64 family)